MTMTRDKIEELNVAMKQAYNALRDWNVHEIRYAAQDKLLAAIADVEAALAERALEPQGQALCHVRYRCSLRWDGNGNNDPQIYEGWEVCEAHERGDDGSDAIPVFAPTAALLPQPQERQELPEPPTLPQSLLNLIGDYGMARTDGCTEFGVISRWTGVIDGIKQYARAYASQLALPAGPVSSDDEIREAVEYITELHGYDIRDEHDEMWTKALVISVVRHLQESPAVAQPVADEREASDAYFGASHPQFDTASNRRFFSAGFRAALCQPAEEGGKS